MTYDEILFTVQSATESAELRLPGESAIEFIDRVEGRYPHTVHYVFHKLLAKCIRERTNVIEAADQDLVREFGTSEDSLRIARRVLGGALVISTSRRGTAWFFPAEWISAGPPPIQQQAKPGTTPAQAYREPSPWEVFN